MAIQHRHLVRRSIQFLAIFSLSLCWDILVDLRVSEKHSFAIMARFAYSPPRSPRTQLDSNDLAIPPLKVLDYFPWRPMTLSPRSPELFSSSSVGGLPILTTRNVRIHITLSVHRNLECLVLLTMYSSNPFGSWSQAGNGHSRNTLWGPAAAHSPSIYGALPYLAPPSAATLTTFYFTYLNPGVLNCTVMGSDSRPLFYVVTDSSMPGYTVLRGLNGKNVALIEWQAHPLVEVRGLICKQAVHKWLGLSSTQRSVHFVLVLRFLTL